MKSLIFVLNTLTSLFISVSYADSAMPKRLLLMVDSVPYQDIVTLQAEGHFKDFFPVSRMISTFPSVSDTAWMDIFSNVPTPAYQHSYYSYRKNSVTGGALSSLSAIEYEKQMHMAFATVHEHILTYLMPERGAFSEINDIFKNFRRARGIPTFYAYMLGVDAMLHEGKEPRKVLLYLEKQIIELEKEYQDQTGEKLEIGLISDHGNNRAKDTKPLNLTAFLESHGYKVTSSLKNENDVIYAVDGRVTAWALYVKPSKVEAVAKLLVQAKALEMVTYADQENPNRVVVINKSGESAEILYQPTTHLYAYRPIAGDPLKYQHIMATLITAGKMNAEGFATAEDWLKFTSGEDYPDGVVRVFRGLKSLALNPAPIVVAAKDGFQYVNSFVKIIDKVIPVGGTHGGLNQVNSAGIVMTNYIRTQDVNTQTVGKLFNNFPDLHDYKAKEPGAEIIDDAILEFKLGHRENWHPATGTKPAFVDFWDPRAVDLSKAGIQTRYKFALSMKTESIDRQNEKRVTTTHITTLKDVAPEDIRLTGTVRPTASEYLLPLSVFDATFLATPKETEYELQILAERIDGTSGKQISEDDIYRINVSVDADGKPIAY